jgi:hypothetical protein
MGITLGDFKSDMTLTWEDDDGVEQGVTAPIDMWVTYILLALSEDQQRNVMDHVIDQIEAENLRRQVLEDEVTASEFDAEYE